MSPIPRGCAITAPTPASSPGTAPASCRASTWRRLTTSSKGGWPKKDGTRVMCSTANADTLRHASPRTKSVVYLLRYQLSNQTTTWRSEQGELCLAYLCTPSKSSQCHCLTMLSSRHRLCRIPKEPWLLHTLPGGGSEEQVQLQPCV